MFLMSLILADLVAAVVAGDGDRVEALVNTGNANLCDEGISLLARAVSQGNKQIVVTLLTKGKASTLSRDPHGFTPLHRACCLVTEDRSIPLEIVKLLVAHGANVNDVNPSPRTSDRSGLGRTPLILASIIGDERVVRALVLSGAEVDYRDKKGLSALDYAALHGRYLVVDYLISVDAEKESALRWAAKGRDDAKTVQERLAFGDINAMLCAPMAFQSQVSIR